MASSSEENLKQQLQELQKQLGKKQMFEEAVLLIKSLLVDHYPSSSPSLRKLVNFGTSFDLLAFFGPGFIWFYSVVCRVATILRTTYTAPGFWLAGLRLFEQAESKSV
ncbi:E3 ubiquitin-protein ligase AIP2 [Vitis vinifera]|uniref:E3 ubiquitin-protein ligase AIP2 n=1 Tax=Vitis vinifera TaxID=29760 RepID=A0A438K8G8_VITVI|nr:E3 ubiquitin-protein ligase AIP2 [Vitis vinifera]